MANDAFHFILDAIISTFLRSHLGQVRAVGSTPLLQDPTGISVVQEVEMALVPHHANTHGHERGN